MKDLDLPDGETVEEQMIERLAAGPSSQVTSWQGYDINGYLFYTVTKDKKTVSQNCGVRIAALDERTEQNTTYFGVIEDIWEVHYGSIIHIPVFRCRWVKHPKGVGWTAMGSQLSTSTILVIKTAHGYLLHRSHRSSM